MPDSRDVRPYVSVTDASLSGWGAHLGSHTCGGLWSSRDTNKHINFLELKCVRLTL